MVEPGPFEEGRQELRRDETLGALDVAGMSMGCMLSNPLNITRL